MKPMDETMWACVDSDGNRHGGWSNEWKLFPTEVGANRFRKQYARRPVTVVKVKVVLAEEADE